MAFSTGALTTHGRHWATYSPLSVSTLTGWYDFSDSSTLFTDTTRTTPVANDGDLIGSVTDKSGGSRHLTRGGAAGTEPSHKTGIQNGLSIARFDGARWLLSGATYAADTAQTVIYVINNPAGATLYGTWARTGANLVKLTGYLNLSANNIQANIGTGAGTYSESWASPAAGWHVVSHVVNNTGPISQTYGDGTLQSHDTGVPSITCDTTAAIGSRSVGALTSGLVGDMAEILFFNTSISSDDRIAVERYLGKKWGVIVA